MSDKTQETGQTEDAGVNYKDTLFLPKTDFPMRAGLPNREPNWIEHWNKIGIYDKLREKAKATKRPPFTLHDGPPYANGNLHIGHALNKILKDMVVRTQQMMGKDARYIPGWDCHGLPIEWKIEEQYRSKGKNKDEVDIIDFRQECRAFAAKWVDVQREEFKRLGITGNWENPYLTMDYRAETVIAGEFQKFLMNGTLYQGSKPIMWSPVEKTALAEAEIEYHDKESHAIWVRFPVLETNNDALKGADVVIWTTTPWTIPSNKAVVFSSTVSYGVYEVTKAADDNWVKVGERVILADARAEDVMAKGRVEEFTRISDAGDLSATQLAHPLNGVEGSNGEWDQPRDFRAAPFVNEEDGTGFVHCSPSHGMDEFEFYRDLNMLEEMITYNVLEDGGLRADLPFFGGKYILNRKGKEGDANAAIMDKLLEVGKLFARGKIKHSYPHSWRSKAPLIFRNTPQWFASVDREVGDGQDTYGKSIRERALRSIDELVTWTPPKGRNRLYAMIEARPDWVLSRQRAWGVPLTCFTKKDALPTDADFLLRNDEVNARILEAFENDGADVWYTDGFKEKMLDGLVNTEDYNQVFDVLDVWFDSGSTHAFVLNDREDGSDDGLADLYLEGTDQHRGWFHSSMLQACGTLGHAPYRGVLTHGFTLDGKGAKMSKSLGNTIVPEKIVKQYGADILRLWVAQTDYTNDQRIGDEILKGTSDSYRRLRNTFRFMLGALGTKTGYEAVAQDALPELEQWILHRLCELDENVRAKFNSYAFSDALSEMFNFCTHDLSALYFDIRKDTLYCDAEHSHDRKAALYVIEQVYDRLTLWLAPILSFTMEEVWLERYPGADSSVHLKDFIDTPKAWRNDALAAKFDQMRTVRRVVTGAIEIERREKRIGSSLEAAPKVYVADQAIKTLLDSVDFANLCITSSIEVIAKDAPEGAFTLDDVEGVGVIFDLATGEKCGRCWKTLPDVGKHSHEAVCGRCDAALG